MDFMGSSMDQDPFSEDETEVNTIQQNYVRWQSSQTPCHALNQLIDSSASHSIHLKESSRSSRIWQREPSFDQIPGFSLLSTTDRPPLSSARTLAKDSSSKSASSSSSRPRPRPSEARARSRSATTVVHSADSSTSNTIPFLDKTNPAIFLDILKGVSAKVDANVGARARANILDSRYPSRIEKVKKRGRSGSVGNGSEALALKAKKVRMESIRLARDKGKGRAVDNDDFEDDGAQNPREHNSMPNITTTSRATLASTDPWVDNSSMDIDNGDKSMADISSDTAFTILSRPGLAKTPSQAKMPPPPAPMTKHPTALNTTPSRNIASTSTLTPLSNSRSEAPHKDLKGPDPRPPDRTPRYHPLLLQQEANKSSSSGQNHPHADINRVSPQQQPISMKTSPTERAPKAETTSSFSSAKPHQHEPPLPVSATLAGNQTTRPPALGMRRTHTLPSAVMFPSISTSGAMPTKQKAFKPPSMSSSQPQSSANNKPAPMTKGPSSATGHNQLPYRQSNTGSRAPPSGSNSSTSSESPSARGYVSSSSFSSTPNTNTPASSASHKASRTPASIAREEAIAKALQEAAAASQAQSQTRGRGPQQPPRLRTVPAPPAPAPAPPPPPAAEPITIPQPASPVLPEPTNGDGDSSFGDISFDMDALEETMRQYD